MTQNPISDVEMSFSAFLRSGDSGHSEEILAALFRDELEPAIKGVVRRSMRVSLRPDDGSPANQDASDLVSEVKILLLKKLRRIKEAESPQIENLTAYAISITQNAYYQYLRNKHPNRLKLTNQLRYLLSHHERFSIWKNSADDWVCASSSQIHDPMKEVTSEFLEANVKYESKSRANLIELAERVFQTVDGPIRFSDFITIVAELMGIKERREVAELENVVDTAADNQDYVLKRLENTEFLKRLWEEMGNLPRRHRAALLLNLRNNVGEGFITLLPLTGIASIGQIAEMLEFSLEEFTRIWNDLPWDDLKIAEHLKLTRQQVINLRQSARAKLRRRLNYI